MCDIGIVISLVFDGDDRVAMLSRMRIASGRGHPLDALGYEPSRINARRVPDGEAAPCGDT
jgi:hypothetical protein